MTYESLQEMLNDEYIEDLYFCFQRIGDILHDCELAWNKLPNSNVRVELHDLCLVFWLFKRECIMSLDKTLYVKCVLELLVSRPREIARAPVYFPANADGLSTPCVLHEYRNLIRNIILDVVLLHDILLREPISESNTKILKSIEALLDD